MAAATNVQILPHNSIALELPQLLCIAVLTTTFFIVRRRYISPIGDVPGPFFASFSYLWKISSIFRGRYEADIIVLHEKHGT